MNFNKVIIWGIDPHSHSHSYIHEAFYKAYNHLGYTCFWLPDSPVFNMDFNNSLFITIGIADKHIPIINNCYYILHNCDNSKYKTLPSNHYIIIQVYTKDAEPYTREYITDNPYIFGNGNLLYIHWMTNLLPYEIDNNIKKFIDYDKREYSIKWVGTINDCPQFGNLKEINGFINEASKFNIPFKYNGSLYNDNTCEKELPNIIDSELHEKYIKNSYMAPAINGHWQRDKGYIPCRIFKNISYGHISGTNNETVYNLFKQKVPYDYNTNNLFYKMKDVINSNDAKNKTIALMEYVRDHFTYVNLINYIMDFFKFVNPNFIYQKLKILHLSFHSGCKNDLDYIFNKFNFYHEFMTINDIDNRKYNIGRNRAIEYWERYKDKFNQFDMIITSDTAPLSRIFLQNNWSKKLIIWICNRFDYSDVANLDCEFPDKEYYELITSATNSKNVKLIGYTTFENFYAKNYKNIDIGNQIIKPIGANINYDSNSIDNDAGKSNLFFIGSYHNDNIMINLFDIVSKLNIPCYSGRYSGPLDLAKYKGVIHIPYAWSNLALFEAIHLSIIYFIPSLNFLLSLKKNKNFFWSPPYDDKYIHISEWYCEENKDIFIFFDSWEDLVIKISTLDFNKQKKILKEFSKKNHSDMLKRWEQVFLS